MTIVRQVARELNSRASNYQIGGLPDLRVRLKGLQRRASSEIFHSGTIHDTYAFHYGGRTELQFNLGLENDAGENKLRHGVAFSLQTNPTLPSISILFPSIKLFNDYVRQNPEAFGDMRMWHSDKESRRSHDYACSEINEDLIRKDNFIFLGKRQLVDSVDYDLILQDFDRLLSLYTFVESRGSIQIDMTGSQSPLAFRPGHTKKQSRTNATLAARELNISLKHNDLQEKLYHELENEFAGNVGSEVLCSNGKIDIVLKETDGYAFYEIKVSATAKGCFREAIGQLLEYAYWPGSVEPKRLVVCGEHPIDAQTEKYLATLRDRFMLPLEYKQIELKEPSSSTDTRS